MIFRPSPDRETPANTANRGHWNHGIDQGLAAEDGLISANHGTMDDHAIEQ
jgi:hypothetical protein